MRGKHGLLLAFLLLTGTAFWMRPEDLGASGKIEVDDPYEAEGAWECPVRPGTEEWIDLGSTAERRAACQPPRETLEAMDTAALLEAALDYPFCSDMLCFDREEDGYQVQLQHNSALAALADRSDRHEVLRARLEGMDAWMDEVGRTCSARSSERHHYLTIFERCMD